MNYIKKHKKFKFLYGLIGLFIIPTYAFVFSQIGPDGDLVLVTFSQIGARYGGIELLIIWGIMTSVYYFSFINYLSILTNSQSLLVRVAITIGCLSMLLSVFLPFAPSMFPITSETHNFLAYVTAVSMVSTLVFFVWNLRFISFWFFFKNATFLLLAVLISIFVLLTYGVSSLFQIVLAIAMCSFLFVMLLFVEKCKKINIVNALEKYYERKQEHFDLY